MHRNYRGSSRKRVGCLIPTLIILCILAGLTLFYVHFNIVKANGGIQLKVPFMDKTIDTSKPKEVPTTTVKQNEQTKPVEPPVTQVKQEPAAPAKPDYATQTEKALYVPYDVLTDANALDNIIALAAGTQVNTLVLDVKPESGKLAFASKQDLAVTANAGTEDNTELVSALGKIEAAGLHAVAQVSCFKDNLAPRKSRTYAVRTKNKVLWLDKNYISWLNPYLPESQQYIIGIVKELNEIGFKDFLLTNMNFPVKGKTSIIGYGDNADAPKAEALDTFMDELTKAVSGQDGLLISATYNDAAQVDGAPSDGQDLGKMSTSFYRIYSPAIEEQNGRGLDSAIFDKIKGVIGDKDFGVRFVPQIDITSKVLDANLQDDLFSANNTGTGWLLTQTSGNYSKNIISK